MNAPVRSESSAAALRASFDRTFAEAPSASDQRFDEFLAVRIGPDPYALRLSDVTGIHADKTIVPIPSSSPALLGIAGFRGGIVPIYDLRHLFGYSANGVPRWTLVARSKAQAIGFAFDSFEMQLRVRREDVAFPDSRGSIRPFLAGVIDAGGVVRPLVDLPAILHAVEGQSPPHSPQKER